MVTAPLRNLQLLAIIVAAVLTAGCGPQTLEQWVASDDLPPTALARLEADRAVAARRDGGRVEVIEYRQEDSVWVRQVLAAYGVADARSSLNLISYGGETGDEWNTFVYGVAPDAVSRVTITGYEGEGGRVVEGAWVIALRERDLTPADIEWRFLDSFGAVTESGSGIFP